jgi:ABC-type nitrate/sulfonate/bicarbonate transport system ATPase subunit
MIRVDDLRVSKNGNLICSVPKLSLNNGEALAIVGRNGCGKTTLLRVLAGLELGYEGRCSIAAERRERVFVHQAPYLFRGTALSNVMYGVRARRLSGGQQRARTWLEKLRVGPLAQSRASQLSGGERRRVALARALATDARLLLLDEPLAEMDDEGIDAVANVLSSLGDASIVITSPTTLPDRLSGIQEYRMS